jgi:hypothetical protein
MASSAPQPRAPSPHGDLSRRRAALWLALIYVVSVGLRQAAKNLQSLPFIYSDEMVHMVAARTVFGGEGLFWGLTPFAYPSWLYPALIAPVLAAFDPLGGIRAAQFVNALTISLTIPLTYRLARRFLPRSRSVAAAGLAGLMTGMSYASLFMAENLFLPLAVAAFGLALGALERPTAMRRIAAGAMFGLLYHVKPQGLFFPMFFALAVVLDAAVAPGAGPRRRFAAVGSAIGSAAARHWLTALAWGAVAALRLAEAAWIERNPAPLTLDAFFGSYAGRARGDYPFQWAGFALMAGCNLAVLAFASGILPALRLAASLPAALRGRGPARWRALVLLTGSAAAVITLASARHTVIADADWCVYERYLMVLFPPLFVLLLLGRPEGFAPPVRPAPARVSMVLASIVIVAGAVAIARWRALLLTTNLPSLAGCWLAHDRGENLLAGRLALAGVALAGPAALWIAAASGRLPRRRPRLAACAVAWLLLLFNTGYYAAHQCVHRPLIEGDKELARKIRREIPADGRLLILIDDMPANVYFQVHFRCPGVALELAPHDEFWFAKPIRFSPGGQIVAPDGQQRTWLLANARWPIEGEPVERVRRFNLYDLSAYPPARMDLERLAQMLEGDTPALPEPDEQGFPKGFELTWMSVTPPRQWRAGDTATVRTTLRNDSPFALRPDDLRYAIGYHWGNHELTGTWDAAVWDDGNYSYLPDTLEPGQSADLEIRIAVPEAPHDGWSLSLAPVRVGEHARLWAIEHARRHTLQVRVEP